MKTDRLKTVMSILTVLFFIILALGSAHVVREQEEYLGNGQYRISFVSERDGSIVREYTASKDAHGRLHGDIIKTYPSGLKIHGRYLHGQRHGMFYAVSATGERENFECYVNGALYDIECPPSMNKRLSYRLDLRIYASHSGSAVYDRLLARYPLLIREVQAHGHSLAALQAFVEELFQAVQGHDQLSKDNFREVYKEILEDFADSSVHAGLGNLLFNVVDAEELIKGKNFELRLGVIDRHYNLPVSTFQVLETTYSDFVERISAQIGRNALQRFADDLDAEMDRQGALDDSDPHLIKNIEDRMEDAIRAIASSHQSTLGVLESDYEHFIFVADPLGQTIQTVLFADTAVKTARILDWAEFLLPDLLSSKGRATYDIDGLYARYYPASNIYLGGYEGALLYYHPAVSPELFVLGTLDEFLIFAEADGF